MRRSIASLCQTKTLLASSVVFFVIIFLIQKKKQTIDNPISVSPQHNAPQEIEYITNHRKLTGRNRVKIGLLYITITKNIHDTSVEDLAHLYEETRELYMDGVDCFFIIDDGKGVPPEIIPQSLMKSCNLSDVGISISMENGMNIMFRQSHLDMFGYIFPKEYIRSQKAFNWLLNVYEGKIYFHSKKTSKNDIPIKDVNGSEAQRIKEDRDLLEKYINVVMKNNTIKPNRTKIIAMSLYGSNPNYTQGAIRNAQLARIHFPDWVLRFYAPPQNEVRKYVIPGKVLDKLTSLQAEVKYVSHELSSVIPPMMLRFLVADDPDVDIFLIQDCDSRLGERISIPVSFWLNSSNAPFYCMRDHPSHSNYAISGGLWGARRIAFVRTLNKTFTHFLKQGFKDRYLQDMNFLNKQVWPLVRTSAFCHDSFSCTKFPGSHPFPVARRGQEHAGQVFDQFDIGRPNDINLLKKAKLNLHCIP